MEVPYRRVNGGICEARWRFRIAKLFTKKQDDDHEDDSDTSTLVNGDKIDKTPFPDVVVMRLTSTIQVKAPLNESRASKMCKLITLETSCHF